jgi:hypothetical protein
MSWPAAILILLGQLALSRHQRRGWVYAGVGNWLFILDFWGQDNAVVVLNLILFVVALRGFLAWRQR